MKFVIQPIKSQMYSTSKCAACRNITVKKLNCIVAIIAGTLFFLGWWLMIDVNAVYPSVIYERKVYYVPGIFSTVALVVVNIVPNHAVNENYHLEKILCSPFVAKLCIFVGLIVAFGAIIGASYILVNDFLMRPEMYQWPGYGVFLQNAFILTSNMLMKFGIRQEAFV